MVDEPNPVTEPVVPPPPPGMAVPGNPTQPHPEGASEPVADVALEEPPVIPPQASMPHDPRQHLRRTRAGLKYNDTRYNSGQAAAQRAMSDKIEQDEASKK